MADSLSGVFMAIYETAYATTICRGMQKTINQIEEGVRQAFYSGGAIRLCDGMALNEVVPEPGRDANIPYFAHPLVVAPVKGLNEDPIYVHDARQYCRLSREGGVIYHNEQERKMMEYRAAVQKAWLIQPQSVLRDISPLPIKLFREWIVQSLVRRYALDQTAVYTVGILVGLWWYSNFTEDQKFTGTDANRVANAISKLLVCRVEDVLTVMDQLDGATIKDAEAFCEALKDITQSQRVKDLNAGLLITAVGSTWYGNHAVEILAVALEHPPTWIAIMLQAASERGMKNSGIAKLMEKQDRGGAVRSFQLAAMSYLRSLDIVYEK